MNKVYVHGPGALEYSLMFFKRGFKDVTEPEKADIVCWTGGEDVDPGLYGEKVIPGTHFSVARDREDINMFHRTDGKFRVGICRGGQFLNVMNGGRMWQDVDGHGKRHLAHDVMTGQDVLCTSTHHQMMIPGDDAVIVGTARESTRKASWHQTWQFDSERKDDPFRDDIEVLYYPKTRSLCFQPHPEYATAPKACTDWFFESLNKFHL